MAKAAVNDIEIYYEVQGRGAPLLLLAGLVGVGASWGPQIPLFAKEFLTIVPDHRGTERSGVPEGGYSIERHASDMAELIRGLKCGPVHVIGDSTGGAVAQVMALDHPDVVRSLVLVATWARTDGYFRLQFESRKRLMKTVDSRGYVEVAALFLWAPTHIRGHEDEIRRWIETTASQYENADIMLKRIDMILAHDQLDRVGQIRQPVFIIVGKEDLCTPSYFSEELAAAIPGAELVVLEGGHFFFLENPGAFHNRVREFLIGH